MDLLPELRRIRAALEARLQPSVRLGDTPCPTCGGFLRTALRCLVCGRGTAAKGPGEAEEDVTALVAPWHEFAELTAFSESLGGFRCVDGTEWVVGGQAPDGTGRIVQWINCGLSGILTVICTSASWDGVTPLPQEDRVAVPAHYVARLWTQAHNPPQAP